MRYVFLQVATWSIKENVVWLVIKYVRDHAYKMGLVRRYLLSQPS